MIRELDISIITDAVTKMVVEANITLPDGVSCALDATRDAETNPLARAMLDDIVENRIAASESRLPLCQDTGMAVFFCEVGQDVHFTGGLLDDALNEGMRRGCADGYLRASVVSDPLRRENTNDNTPAVIYTRLIEGDKVYITFLPKGFGSENMSAVKMFNPTVSASEIEDFIASVAVNAGGSPCPPVVVGVGLGGTMDSAAVASKYCLAREVGTPNGDAFYDEMEKRIVNIINANGCGPMGIAGKGQSKTTALAVHILPLATHIAGLPCAVNICCHCARHKRIEI